MERIDDLAALVSRAEQESEPAESGVASRPGDSEVALVDLQFFQQADAVALDGLLSA